MNQEPNPVALHAAGIMDALYRAGHAEADGGARFKVLLDELHGFIGLAEGVANAAGEMERFRTEQGADSEWGIDLPHVYDAWHLVAAALWAGLSPTNAARLTRFVLEFLLEENGEALEVDASFNQPDMMTEGGRGSCRLDGDCGR